MSLEPCPRAIIGGTLIDGTGKLPLKDSVVVIDGEWVSAVGKKGEVNVPADSEVIDASGRTVLPGFIDAHTHFLNMGIRMIQYVDLSTSHSLAEAIKMVRERLDETPKGNWVLGRGWDESKWPERHYIIKEDLDPFSPDHPIMLSRIDGHLITLNSRALKLAGITRATPNPPGGQVDKGVDGEPVGTLRDARHLVDKVLPRVTESLAVEGLKVACERALSLGCTSIHDAGIDAFEISAYQSAAKKEVLKTRAYMMFDDELLRSILDVGLKTGFGNELVKLGPLKIVFDGSLGARTAALFEPYDDDPSTKGLLLLEVDVLKKLVREAHLAGLQVAIHAIGDRGIEYAIDAFEEALKTSPRKGHRHRIEHCEIMSATQIERVKQLGIIPSMQPNFVGEWSDPGGMYENRIGKRRLRQNNPYRALLDEGIHVAFGSDGMPFNPIYGIWSAVNHYIRGSRITLEEAIKCYTLDAAYAAFEEDLKGSLEPGKLADITIMSEDLTSIPAEKIRDVPVHMTIVNGKILYYKE